MHHIRRYTLWAASLLLVLLVPVAGQSFNIGIDVSPAKLEIELAPGATYTVPVTIHNSSPDQTHVQASMVDFGVDPKGGYQFDKVGAKSNSLMKYASIRPREFDLAPETTQQVSLTIVMPNDPKLSGEYAGIVFFQTRPVRGRGNGVAFSARVASKIYESIPGTVKIDGAITKMSSSTGPRGQVYRINFNNNGNAHVYLSGQVVIQKGGQLVDQIAMENGMLVERGGYRLIEVNGKRLQPGSYQAIATVDYGGKTETGGEIEFSVK